MSRFLLLRVLFAVALLSGGGAPAVHGSHPEPTVEAELVSTRGDSAGAALRASGLTTLVRLVEPDGRGGRFSGTVQTAREHNRVLHAAGRARGSSGRKAFYSDLAARLLRGGIDSSTLGTPPPQS